MKRGLVTIRDDDGVFRRYESWLLDDADIAWSEAEQDDQTLVVGTVTVNGHTYRTGTPPRRWARRWVKEALERGLADKTPVHHEDSATRLAV